MSAPTRPMRRRHRLASDRVAVSVGFVGVDRAVDGNRPWSIAIADAARRLAAAPSTALSERCA